MMFLFAFVAYVATCVVVDATSYHDDEVWREYKERFGKVYSSSGEEKMRYDVWLKAVEEINSHNVQYGDTYEQGMNQFTDMTNEEYKEYYTGLLLEHVNDTELTSDIHESQGNAQLPDSVDWLKKGYVTGVKNQGRCGSCYSFAATGALEGQWFKKTGRLISMSEQQIVDCSYKTYHNRGCHGGWFQFSWMYVRDAGGEDSEESYPYTAKRGQCHFKSSSVVAKVKGYKNVKSHSEEALQDAVANIGPVAVALDASNPSFRRYKSGVYYEPSCSPRNLVHAVLCVGYGNENGQDYWLVKNSWGTKWGLSGYIKMARNKNNHCGIATRPAYPLV